MAHRLLIRSFTKFPDLNPNGNRRPARIVAEGDFVIGGAFLCRGRLVRNSPDGPAELQLAKEARDLGRGRMEPFTFPEDLRQAVAAALSRRMLIEESRRYQRGPGRN